MKKIDVVEVIEAISTYYPGTFKIDDLEKTADAWLIFLKDSDKKIVMKNLETHIKTHKFPPAISELLVIPEGRYIPDRDDTLKIMGEILEKQRLSKEERTKAAREVQLSIKKTLNDMGIPYEVKP